jgi:O-succinylbenzoic acid--CoA ligase
LGLQAAARWLLCMPLYHVGGLSIVLRCCLYGTTVVLQVGFDLQVVSDALDRDAITLVSLVPTMLHRLLDLRSDAPFPESVCCVLLGGAAASAQLIERCLAGNIPIALTYGLTEACSQVATATPRQTRVKPGSVGKSLNSTKVQIVNDTGELLPQSEIGMILVSGDTVMAGYYGQPEATQEVLDDGWLRTGDLGYQDEDGDLWVVQRRTDLIVSGGENIYPAEIEAVLTAHPAIAAACVVGMEDPEWGQQVTALIETRGAEVTEAEVLAYCREHLAGYKLPRAIVFTDALPCTASGKVQRGKAAEIVQNNLLMES